MTPNEVLEVVVKVLDSKKAEELKVIKITDLTIIADYFVIASANNTTLVKALCDEVEFQLKEKGVEPLRIEGYDSRNWILMDYGSVVVHIFYSQTRDFYSLERLWKDGENLDINKLLNDK